MPYKFGEYEIVKLKSQKDLPLAAVRGWDETGMIYELRFSDRQEREAHESELETTGQYETPFRFYEVVEIHPIDLETEPSVVDFIGKRGVITSIAANDNSDDWLFCLVTQTGNSYCFERNELQGTGIILSEAELYGTDTESVTVRLHWDPVTQVETVVSGNPAFLKREPMPLRIDLEAL